MKVAAVIPARDEAATVGEVVDAARDASLVDQIVVVDNGSADDTALVARQHGAEVVDAPAGGKGEAMRAGVDATAAELIVFLDADLVGLTPGAVDRLVRQVRDGDAAMACGLFDRGPRWNPLFLKVLPVLTGQRALHRSLFDQLGPRDIRGYRVEAALNRLVACHGLPRRDDVVPGLWHRMKEQKSPNAVVGVARKVVMFSSVGWAYVRPGFARRHRQGRSRGSS